MSKIKNDGLDQYGAEPFEQQQFGTTGVEGVNHLGDSSITLRMMFWFGIFAVSLYDSTA